MNYYAAKRQIITKRIIGALLIAISSLFVLAGLLLFLYTSFDSSGQVLASLSLLVKRLVYGVIERTQAFHFIWNNAPVPSPTDLTSKGTLGFFGWYMTMFVGASLIGSANKLARRLRIIDEQIENEVIRESLKKGNKNQMQTEFKQSVSIPSQPIWQQFHTLYLAPFIVGLILWVIGKAID